MKKKNAIIDDSRKEKACKIARTYCENELVHGMPHINRMLRNFKELKRKNKKLYNSGGLVKEILDAVELSVILHDIGKKIEKPNKKHGAIAIEILKEDYIDFFNEIPHHDWLEYAINGHTDGIEIGKCKFSKTPKKICLTLLSALDNIDAIGEIGVHRDLKDMRDKFKWLLDKNKGDESFLERLLTNYCRIDGTDDIDGNVSRIKKIKSKINTKVLLELYDKLRTKQEEYIFKLIKEKKLKITDSKIEKVLKSPDFCN